MIDNFTNNTILTLKCDKCGKSFDISGKSYRQRIREGRPNLCFECMKEYANNKSKETKQNMSKEQKAEYSKKLSGANKNYWANIDDETKAKRFEALKKQNDELQKSMTPEKRKELIQKILDGKAKMSESEIADMRKKMSESMKAHHANMTDEDKKEFSQQIKAGMERMTNDEKQEMKDAWRNWYDHLPESIKNSRNDELHNNLQNYWDTIPSEIKIMRSEELNNAKVNWWNNLSEEEKQKEIRKMIIKSAGKNKLHKKFEEYFSSSMLVNNYSLVSECVLTNNGVTHSWDYGIYDMNNTLQMVVDLDGSYYHADECDYDGLHSKEEYDESRSQSVPDGVRVFIIQEERFTKCFELMVKELIVGYEDYIYYIFEMCRMMPFPYPKYNDKELIKSFSDLKKMDCNDKYHSDIALNTRQGDRLIQHFHESIYHAHRRGEISPHEAWYDDNLLLKCIQNRIVYQNHINPNKILQGFNISKIAQKVSVFSAGRAKLIINKYLSEFDTVFDPFSGFSGRLLGTISLGKKYIGQDISPIHVRESNNMIEFLSKYFNFEATITQQDILNSSGSYPCLFTCSPYSDKEQWVDVEVDIRSCDDWIDVCLKNFNCQRYVFVVDTTEKYKDNVVQILSNKSHLNKNNEMIILIDKKL